MAGIWDGYFKTAACLWSRVSCSAGWTAGKCESLWWWWTPGEAGEGKQPPEKAKHGFVGEATGKWLKITNLWRSHSYGSADSKVSSFFLTVVEVF